jgi:hypothetical protein
MLRVLCVDCLRLVHGGLRLVVKSGAIVYMRDGLLDVCIVVRFDITHVCCCAPRRQVCGVGVTGKRSKDDSNQKGLHLLKSSGARAFVPQKDI